MFGQLRDDIATILQRDAAARNAIEVILCYPGFHALTLHRLAHGLWQAEWYLLARILSNTNRFWTGIEIHPGATIGKHCFIDHGMGVVIGETAVVGDNVTLFQGVTLGGTGKEKGKKRHPTIKNRVVIGSGAKILGNITIGHDSVIGASSVVLANIPENATVVGIPGRVVTHNGQRLDTLNHDEPNDAALQYQLEVMQQQLADLQSCVEAPAPLFKSNNADDLANP